MSTTTDRTTLFIQHPDVLVQTIDNDVVLLHPEKGEYYGLQQPGAHIWELLAVPMTGEAIVAKLVEEFEGEPSIIEADVISLLSHLLDEDLIKVADT